MQGHCSLPCLTNRHIWQNNHHHPAVTLLHAHVSTRNALPGNQFGPRSEPIATIAWAGMLEHMLHLRSNELLEALGQRVQGRSHDALWNFDNYDRHLRLGKQLPESENRASVDNSVWFALKCLKQAGRATYRTRSRLVIFDCHRICACPPQNSSSTILECTQRSETTCLLRTR